MHIGEHFKIGFYSDAKSGIGHNSIAIKYVTPQPDGGLNIGLILNSGANDRRCHAVHASTARNSPYAYWLLTAWKSSINMYSDGTRPD